MSQHRVIAPDGVFEFVFGWDQPLMSFYLQVHDRDLPEEINPVIWLGATPKTTMYEVEDLVPKAREFGLELDTEMQRLLFSEKDGGI